jgi:hypothetical protein
MDEAVLLPQSVEEASLADDGSGPEAQERVEKALPEIVDCLMTELTDDGEPVQAGVAQVTSSLADEDGNDSTTSDASSMSFNLQTSGLALQIKTKMAANITVVELKSKLEFALLMLAQTETRLEAAQRRIGFLEAQLETQAQQDSPPLDLRILLPKN